MSVLSILPGTRQWLLARLDLRVLFALRTELRALVAMTDASYAGLFITRAPGPSTDELEWAGEHVLGPRALPELRSTMPSFGDVVCRDGDARHSVIHRVRLGRQMPQLGLSVVDPGPGAASSVFEVVELSAHRLEEIVVTAIA